MRIQRNYDGTATFEKSGGKVLKILNMELAYDPAISLLGIYLKETKKSCPYKHMHMNGHSNIIQNSQKIGTPQMSMHY